MSNIVNIELMKDNIHIQFNTTNVNTLKGLNDNFSEFTPGFRYSPKFQAGIWDGKISLFKKHNRSLPYGLLLDAVKYLKSNNIEYNISTEVKMLFGDSDKIPVLDNNKMGWKLREYQYDIVETCLQFKKCCFLASVRAGKTMILYHVWNSAYNANQMKKLVVIVPNISLVDQFYNDWIDYGIERDDIGRVNGNYKEWDNKVVVATWQTLKNNKDKLKEFDAIFVDETHKSKALQISTILQNMKHAKWRIGCTGTFPDNRLDDLNVRSYLGPVVKQYTMYDLKEMGYIADCNINLLNISYSEKYSGSYNDVKDSVFSNKNRLRLITDVIKHIDSSVLILIQKIAKEGDVLKKFLNEQPELLDFEIGFVSGRDKQDIRKKWIDKMNDKKKKIILIASYPLFSTGLTLPNLTHLILGSSSKSKLVVIQSVGRALCKTDEKEVAQIWDICDNVPILEKHSPVRERHYDREKFKLTDYSFIDKDNFYDKLNKGN